VGRGRRRRNRQSARHRIESRASDRRSRSEADRRAPPGRHGAAAALGLNKRNVNQRRLRRSRRFRVASFGLRRRTGRRFLAATSFRAATSRRLRFACRLGLRRHDHELRRRYAVLGGPSQLFALGVAAARLPALVGRRTPAATRLAGMRTRRRTRSRRTCHVPRQRNSGSRRRVNRQQSPSAEPPGTRDESPGKRRATNEAADREAAGHDERNRPSKAGAGRWTYGREASP